MQLVLEGKTLEDLDLAAENYLLEREGQPLVKKENAKRGRPTNAERAAKASSDATAGAATASAPAAPEPAKVVAAPPPPPAPEKPKSKVSRDQLTAAMKELIAAKGAEFAAKLLAEKFAPATRSVEIPEEKWEAFVMAVALATAPAAVAAPTPSDLI